MIRSILLAFGIAMFLAMPAAYAQSVNTSLCVYDSKDYSDGAYICAQKSMMLTCQVDGAKAIWKIVTDKDLNDRCIAPIVRSNIAEPRRYRRHFAQPPVTRVADPSAKCFNFNGKRYCE